MASARDIKRQIQSVESTQKITKAMKMVSAAKMRKAVEAMTSARPYSAKMSEVIKDIAIRSGDSASNKYMETRENVKTIGLILISSDKGLCGAFNSNVIKEAFNRCLEHGAEGVRLYIVGKKAYDFFKRRPYPIAKEWITLGGKYTFDTALEVGKLAVADFEEGTIDELHVIYNEFVSTSSQNVKRTKILPVAVDTEGASESEVYPDFSYEPSVTDILEKILPQYINTIIYQGLMESVAGEQGARMVAMDSATRNAGEMIKKLVLNYNKARQAAITTELLDIVNGAEALNS